jgi:hypothetical protein
MDANGSAAVNEQAAYVLTNVARVETIGPPFADGADVGAFGEVLFDSGQISATDGFDKRWLGHLRAKHSRIFSGWIDEDLIRRCTQDKDLRV